MDSKAMDPEAMSPAALDPEESMADANEWAGITSVPTDKTNNNEPTNRFDSDELYYDMAGEKYLLIFNHLTYHTTAMFRNTRPSDRHGTEEDVNSLKRVFQKLDYKVIVYQNYVYEDIMRTINNFSNQDHSKTSCLCIAILTHGDKDECLYAADMPYDLKDITFKLEYGHHSLVGKPKLFFIQACRGKNLDAGRTLQVDSAGGYMVIPSTADFLYFRSSVEGYVSFRNQYGSFLIQELCKALENNYDKDIHYITTIVNHQVAYNYITYNPKDKKIHNKKTMPEVRHTLTKFFKFY